jgi:hypothetical protein
MNNAQRLSILPAQCIYRFSSQNKVVLLNISIRYKFDVFFLEVGT